MLMALLRGRLARSLISSQNPKLEMMEPPKARLAYLTIPEPAVLLLNLQIEGEFMRIEISREQLAGIVVIGVRELLSTGGKR